MMYWVKESPTARGCARQTYTMDCGPQRNMLTLLGMIRAQHVQAAQNDEAVSHCASRSAPGVQHELAEVVVVHRVQLLLRSEALDVGLGAGIRVVHVALHGKKSSLSIPVLHETRPPAHAAPRTCAVQALQRATRLASVVSRS